MNLNKYTKAELISKLRKTDAKSDSTKLTLFNQIKSFLCQIWDLIMIFKNIIIKLTFISLIIKIFKIYRIFRTLWKIINTIVRSIFGISLLENFGIEAINNFINEIRIIGSVIVDYFTSTQFYSYISSFFKAKEEVTKTGGPQSEKSSRIYKESSSNERKIGQSDVNSKISEWLKPEEKPKHIEESDNTKYYVIAGMIIFCCIAWYYSDEIKTGGLSLMEWLRNIRRRPDNGPDNLPPVAPVNNPTMTERIRKFFIRGEDYHELENEARRIRGERLKHNVRFTDHENSSQSTIKPIDLVDNTQIASTSKIEPVEVHLSGLSEIRSDNFEQSTSAIMKEIDHFFKNNFEAAFPVLAVQRGLYDVLRNRLQRLSEVDKDKYNNLVENPEVTKKISEFLNLEKEIIFTWYIWWCGKSYWTRTRSLIR